MSPGLPYPSVLSRPLGPTIDKPRVRRTSIGKIESNSISVSLSNVKVSVTKELSSPKADSGIDAMKTNCCATPGIRVGFRF